MSTLMDGTLTKIIGKNNPDSSRDKLTIGSDLVVRGNQDVKFYGETPGNFMLWNSSAETLEVVGQGIVIKQKGQGDYQPNLTFYNYDADIGSGTGMNQIKFYNSKSDTETEVALAEGDLLSRQLNYSNAGAGAGINSGGPVYAGSIQWFQRGTYDSTDYIGGEFRVTTYAKKSGAGTNSGKLSFMGPLEAAAGDTNKPSLVVHGSTVPVLPAASATQVVIANGLAAEVPGAISLGSVDVSGTRAVWDSSSCCNSIWFLYMETK